MATGDVQVHASFTISAAELEDGWEGRLAELNASVRARLEAIVDDNGNEALPKDLFVEVSPL